LAIGFVLRKHWLEIAWGVFAAANVAVIVALGRWETIPFHLIWVSLTLVYGWRRWSPGSTGLTLAAVMVVTGGALLFVVRRGHERPDEIAEVPLMASMFVAMVWHARKRQAATEEARRLADKEHRLLEAGRDFLRDASHELKTPITVARGHAELIRATHPTLQVEADIEVVLDELDRISAISERLLLLAAAENHGFLNKSLISLEEFLARTDRRWNAAAPRRWNVESEGRVWLTADKERLEIAIDALLENAVKATTDGQAITLKGYRLDGKAVIEVVDTGRGIPAADLERIFDRFARTDEGRARRDGGIGLGLPIVKAIIEAHGGGVSIDSRPGRGSVVRMTLPASYVGSFEAADAVLRSRSAHTEP
jgi:signal transduction histidine kinase